MVQVQANSVGKVGAEVNFLMEGERGKGVAAIDSLITTKLHRLEEAAHRRYLTGELPP